MDIMLVGGVSPLMRRLSLKLYKEGHRIFLLSGSRNPVGRCEHIFEQYDFPYSASSVEELFRSINPDVTIVMGAFDGNLYKNDLKNKAVEYAAGLQNTLYSWAALNKGRLIFLSSVEVYGDSYQIPVTEAIKPMPGGLRSMMILQAEESCRFYQNQLDKDVIILRLDRLYDVPKDINEAALGICESMCLEAFRDGTVTYRKNYMHGLTYTGDAIESIYKVITCQKHRFGLYNISSGKAFSESQIANAVFKAIGKEPEQIDNTLEEQRSVILSNERIKEEFGFEVRYEPEEIVQKTLKYMKRHSGRFLDREHPGQSIWRRIYYKTMKSIGAWVPYIENLLLFIPFFMLNNRATESLYFSKIDFYLIYVLLFAVVHGQRQATFSAFLATAGYIFRQMYNASGLAIVTDYNTYVWIAEIFIVGLMVGYMKDRINNLKEEKEQEIDFLAERVTDITDINDSNLRVKEGLITQVVNYNYSMGTVYEMIEELGEDNPTKILFRALTLMRNVTDCKDVSVYLVNQKEYARLFGYTSQKSASMGDVIYLPDKKPFYDAFSKNIVFLNRNMDSEYPMMAYCICEDDKPVMMLMLWSIPFERMTIDESNRLIVLGKLIYKSVKRAENYLELSHGERYSDNGVLKSETFEELVETYREAEKKNMIRFTLLKVISAQSDMQGIGAVISEIISATYYTGYGNDGSMYILVTGTDRQYCDSLIGRLEQIGISTVISKELGA